MFALICAGSISASSADPTGLSDIGAFGYHYNYSGTLDNGFAPSSVNNHGVVGGDYTFVDPATPSPMNYYEERWPALWINGTTTPQPFDHPNKGDVHNTRYCSSTPALIDDANRQFGAICDRTVLSGAGGYAPAWWGTTGQAALWPGGTYAHQTPIGITAVSPTGIATSYSPQNPSGGCPNSATSSAITNPPDYATSIPIPFAGCAFAVNDSGHYLLESATGTTSLFDGTNLVALPTTDTWLGIDAKDDVLGVPPAGSTGDAADLVLRKADGTIVPIPIAPTAGVPRLAPNGTVVGEVGTTWMIWRGGAAQPIADLLPPGGDWTITGVIALTSNYLVGQGQHAGQTHDFLLALAQSYTVSGHVYGQKCGPTCSRPPIEGGGILVTGNAADGSAVSKATSTAADGSWSVMVPNGSYKAGPTLDGSTLADLRSFVPNVLPVTVNGADVPGQDFVTCVESGSAGALRSGGPPATAASAGSPDCVTNYTIDVKASIAQSQLVDPSLDAHFRVGREGYNDSDYWFTHYLRSTRVTRELAALPTFPACRNFSFSGVRRLTRENAKIKWYSYIQGGKDLGSASVTFGWNQSQQKVQYVSGPTIKQLKLTRVFRYELEERGKKLQIGRCAVTEKVPVLLAPVLASAEVARGHLKPEDFTIVAAWGLPFDPAGLKIDTDNTLGQNAKDVASDISKFMSAHPAAGLFYDTGKLVVSFIGVGKLLHLAKAASLVRAGALFTGEALAGAQKTIAYGINGLHLLALAKDLPEAGAILGGLFGYGEEDSAYPLMSAVIRGHFHTSPNPYGKVGGVLAISPARTTLAVSAVSTGFPNISMTVERAPMPNANPSIDTYSGILPWITTNGLRNASNLYVANGSALARNPRNMINHSTEKFDEGKEDVERLTKEFKHMKPVQETLLDSGLLVDDDGFPKENKLAPAPNCSDALGKPAPVSSHTICWQFVDGLG